MPKRKEPTPKQKAFADEFLKCGNQTEAAKRAGYSEKTARQAGAENMKKPVVLEYIQKRQKQIDDTIKSRIASTWKFSELGNKTILTYITELKAKAPVFGTTSLIETPANTYKDTTVKFGKTFSKAPTVLVSLSGGSQNTKSFGVEVLSTTTSSCVIRTVNGHNSSVSMFVNWCALI